MKVRWKWIYIYRAVDRNGKTLNFRLSAKRDVGAAKTLFRKAINTQGCTPKKITLDGCAASHRAVNEMKADGMLTDEARLRSSKYLNDLIEQHHRAIKLWGCPMLGFKRYRNAAIVISGIELPRRIHKDQFDLSRLRLKGATAPAIWNAVLGF